MGQCILADELVSRDQVVDVFPQHLHFPITKEPLGGGIPGNNAIAAVNCHHGGGAVVQERFKVAFFVLHFGIESGNIGGLLPIRFFTGAERLFGAHPFANIVILNESCKMMSRRR